jgi:hypothetical protein
MNSDAIITVDDITTARRRIDDDTLGKTVDTLLETEPELYGYIMAAIHAMAGRLALFRVDNDVLRHTADEALELVLTCLIANRMSHDRLWSDAGPTTDSDNAESH